MILVAVFLVVAITNTCYNIAKIVQVIYKDDINADSCLRVVSVTNN